MELYSGREVELHFRYATIMNFVFVAFLHGASMPILFPIACFGILNMYIVERLQFAYFYKQPPLLDNQLNEKALGMLQYAPVFMLLMIYW